MGSLFYGDQPAAIQIEDRTLAHLKVVIATKLRRSESFTLSWRHPDDQPPGRTTIWLHSSIPLRFVFDHPAPVQISKPWITELAASANSSGGITLTAEHFTAAPQEVPLPETPVISDAPRLAVQDAHIGEVAIEQLSAVRTFRVPAN